MNQRGMVYVVSLGVAFMLTVIGASLLVRSVSEQSLSQRSRDQSAALHFAEAGVDQAARNLRTPTDPDDDTTDSDNAAKMATRLPGGRFTLDPTSALGNNRYQVVSHGTSDDDPSYPRDIEATFQLKPKSIFDGPLFGDEGVTIGGSAITDSYNSCPGGVYNADGSCAAPKGYNACLATNAQTGVCTQYNKNHNGDIGTNATTTGGLTVSGSIFIDGQVAVGPDVVNPISVISSNCSPQPSCIQAYITGGTSPPSDDQDVFSQDVPLPLPAVTLPGGLTSCTNQTITGGNTLTLSPTGGPLGNGTYCFNNLTVQGNATLTATDSVTVYLTGKLTARGDSVVGVTNNPSAMSFLMTSGAEATLEQGTITGHTTFYGSLFGPDATIDISGNADVYGSIVAEQINVTGSASVHYDESLADCDLHPEHPGCSYSQHFTTSLVSWREL